MNFTNLNSTAISDISVNNNVATITFKGSNKSYDYTINNDSFVNDLNLTVQNGQSVGRFINKAIKEDQTLQIVAV